MEARIDVQPLPYKTRQRTFLMLFLVFIVSLPFLYLYATGYRFDFRKPTNLVSTGGIYVAVDMAEADIYIDGELVRETRTFRKAFYAQSLDVGTHRVHVQKEGYHTWVKELPVSKRLVTEAESFNLPLVPQVRVISEWQSATGSAIVAKEIVHASSTNVLLATTTKVKTAFVRNEEYMTLLTQFGTTTQTAPKQPVAVPIRSLISSTGTTTEDMTLTATSTIFSGGVRLARGGEDLYATWVGSFEQMPYYYCAPDFPPYSTSTPVSDITADDGESLEGVDEEEVPEGLVIHPVQTISKDVVCDPTIRIDRKWQEVRDFDFFPGSTDFVIVVLQNGIYVVEIDDRSWQNVQPLMVGENLRMHIENGTIFVYDGTLVYQIVLIAE